MPYIVRFHDNPTQEHQRSAHMAAHLSFLEANADHIQIAGPLLDGDQVAGGLWLVEADSPDTVEALIRADPFFPTGLRDRWEVLTWRQVFREGTRQV